LFNSALSWLRTKRANSWNLSSKFHQKEFHHPTYHPN
jgi:hypothetical protein